MGSEKRVVLVTGSTDGIGRAAASQLGSLGWVVLVHGRLPERVVQAVTELRRAEVEADGVVADFASFRQVRRMAEELVRTRGRLDALVNNAGTYLRTRQVTEDGHEATFQVNYLSHFLLTLLLLPLLQRSAPSRILNAGSVAHLSGSLDLEDPDFQRRRYSGYEAYAASKLAMVAFALSAAERLRGSGVTSNAFHPGVIATKLLKAGFGRSPGRRANEGAKVAVRLAASRALEGVSGRYFDQGREDRPSRAARDPLFRERLWRLSQQLTGPVEAFEAPTHAP